MVWYRTLHELELLRLLGFTIQGNRLQHFFGLWSWVGLGSADAEAGVSEAATECDVVAPHGSRGVTDTVLKDTDTDGARIGSAGCKRADGRTHGRRTRGRTDGAGTFSSLMMPSATGSVDDSFDNDTSYKSHPHRDVSYQAAVICFVKFRNLCTVEVRDRVVPKGVSYALILVGGSLSGEWAVDSGGARVRGGPDEAEASSSGSDYIGSLPLSRVYLLTNSADAIRVGTRIFVRNCLLVFQTSPS